MKALLVLAACVGALAASPGTARADADDDSGIVQGSVICIKTYSKTLDWDWWARVFIRKADGTYREVAFLKVSTGWDLELPELTVIRTFQVIAFGQRVKFSGLTKTSGGVSFCYNFGSWAEVGTY